VILRLVRFAAAGGDRGLGDRVDLGTLVVCESAICFGVKVEKNGLASSITKIESDHTIDDACSLLNCAFFSNPSAS
jgi:hypothetical protein